MNLALWLLAGSVVGWGAARLGGQPRVTAAPVLIAMSGALLGGVAVVAWPGRPLAGEASFSAVALVVAVISALLLVCIAILVACGRANR